MSSTRAQASLQARTAPGDCWALRPVPLLVIVVNYRTPDLTESCLLSLEDGLSEIPGAHVVLVENGSGDGSLERLRELQAQRRDWVTVFDTGANLGFAGGVNAGFHAGPPCDLLLLLNSDARIHRSSLQHCITVMGEQPQIGALSCAVLNEDGSIQNVTRRFPTPLRLLAGAFGLPWYVPRLFQWADTEDPGWDRSRTRRDVDWIGGAFLMTRGDLVRRIGLLDDDFFFYGEDVEFCYRVWRSGSRCHYDPRVTVTHLGARSSAAESEDPWRTQQLFLSRYLVQRKCHGTVAEYLLRSHDLIGAVARWALRKVRPRSRNLKRSRDLRARIIAAVSRPTPRVSSRQGAGSPATRPRPLRVLMALPGLHRVNRGAEVVFENLAGRLSRRLDCHVTLVGAGPARPGSAYSYRRARCLDRGRFQRFPRLPVLRSAFSYEEVSFVPGLIRSYRPDDYDVTLTCSFPFTHWVLRHRRGSGTRPAHVFITENGDWAPRRMNSEYRSFSCDGLVCTNPEYFERHQSTWNCRLIPNGVDVERFRPGPSERSRFGLPGHPPLVLVASALSPGKRVMAAVEALSGTEGVGLVVAGGGPEAVAIEKAGRRLLPGRFHRLEVASEEMPALYRSVDALLHMSLDEPFGNVYLEALASGLPVIADDNPRTRWIVEDAADLVDTRDPAKVSEAVVDAVAPQPLQLVQRRRELAIRRYSWEVVAEQYFDFLEDVVHGRTS